MSSLPVKMLLTATQPKLLYCISVYFSAKFSPEAFLILSVLLSLLVTDLVSSSPVIFSVVLSVTGVYPSYKILFDISFSLRTLLSLKKSI